MPRGQPKLPDGMVSEKTLRSLIHSIMTKLKKETLSVKQTLALLREQERLSRQLKETAAARLEIELMEKKSGISGSEEAMKRGHEK